MGEYDTRGRTALFHGLFGLQEVAGEPRLSRLESAPSEIPCPATGRSLRVATIDVETPAICPRCAASGLGGFVSFVEDLRMAYACPTCLELVWLAGS